MAKGEKRLPARNVLSAEGHGNHCVVANGMKKVMQLQIYLKFMVSHLEIVNDELAMQDRIMETYRSNREGVNSSRRCWIFTCDTNGFIERVSNKGHAYQRILSGNKH